MKKIVFVAAMLLAMVGAKAQTNIQEMYDFNRGHFTTTLEMFKSDNWGSTFFFTDIYHPNQIMPTGYYTEISRALNFWHGTPLNAFSLHLEWNGGQFANNCYLFGVEYFLHNADYSNTFTFELMYKNIHGMNNYLPFQFTFVWGLSNIFGANGLSFSGFLDIWSENTFGENTIVALAEPQLWYNVGRHFNCPNLMVGGEIELAYNFAGGYHSGLAWAKNEGFNVAPCLGIKWAF